MARKTRLNFLSAVFGGTSLAIVTLASACGVGHAVWDDASGTTHEIANDMASESANWQVVDDEAIWWPVYARDYGEDRLDACHDLQRMMEHPHWPWFGSIGNRLHHDLRGKAAQAEIAAHHKAEALIQAHATHGLAEELRCTHEKARIDNCMFGGRNTFVMIKAHVKCDVAASTNDQ